MSLKLAEPSIILIVCEFKVNIALLDAICFVTKFNGELKGIILLFTSNNFISNLINLFLL